MNCLFKWLSSAHACLRVTKHEPHWTHTEFIAWIVWRSTECCVVSLVRFCSLTRYRAKWGGRKWLLVLSWKLLSVKHVAYGDKYTHTQIHHMFTHSTPRKTVKIHNKPFFLRFSYVFVFNNNSYIVITLRSSELEHQISHVWRCRVHSFEMCCFTCSKPKLCQGQCVLSYLITPVSLK